MTRPVHETLSDNGHIIVAGLGLAVGAVAVSAIFYFAVIPLVDLAAEASAQFIRSVSNG